jgi:hypothetical protein
MRCMTLVGNIGGICELEKARFGGLFLGKVERKVQSISGDKGLKVVKSG